VTVHLSTEQCGFRRGP